MKKFSNPVMFFGVFEEYKQKNSEKKNHTQKSPRILHFFGMKNEKVTENYVTQEKF